MGLVTLGDLWPGREDRDRPTWSPPAEGGPLPDPVPKLCPKTGKIRHPRKIMAERQLAEVQGRSPDETLQVYVCRWCYSWHVGHL